MVYFRLFEETRVLDGKEYEAYGVAAFDECGEMVTVVPDITVKKDKALSLARMCEKMELSPLHLRDVAEDYIISENS